MVKLFSLAGRLVLTLRFLKLNVVRPTYIVYFEKRKFSILKNMDDFCIIEENQVLDNVEFHSRRKIGTHNGTFHCDEVLACFLLKCLPENSDAVILRSRNPNLLSKCDIVVDVGGVFDPSSHRYDHHQRSFKESMNSLDSVYPWITKLSSAGLVYFYFGQKIISIILNADVDTDSAKIKAIFKKVYENFVEEIDAIDNGIDTHDGTPRYKICTNLSSRVKHLNPAWNQKNENQNGFDKALKMVGPEFVNTVKNYANVWWPAKPIVELALKNRKECHESGEIIELNNGGCPWKEHLFTCEEELMISPSIKFVLYPDENRNWRVQCVPINLNTFKNRLSLKEEWCGLRGEELSIISGIPDCIFVHANGFIGGHKNREGALKMAVKTLESVVHV